MNFIVFPGQASQYPGMGKDWYENFSQARDVFEESSDNCSLNLKKLCFDGTDADLKPTEITQPAILTTCTAIWRSLAEIMDVAKLTKNALFAGHSLGEYSALVATGALALGPAVSFVRKRGAAMQSVVPHGQGGMIALIFRPKTENTLKKAQDLCEKIKAHSVARIWPANINSAEQFVLAGDAKAVAAIKNFLTNPDFNIRQAIELEVSAPFHCPLMKPAKELLEAKILDLPFCSADKKYIANVDAQIYDLNSSIEGTAQRLVAQIDSPVLWWQSAQRALEQGYDQVIEIGPKKVLTSLCKRIEWQGRTFTTFNIDKREDAENARNSMGS